MIEAKNLRKTFSRQEVETTALNRINLKIMEGEFVAIMGPSGSGKSTLLNILGLLDDPSEGEYYFLESEMSKLSELKKANVRKKNIGFVFQNFNLIDQLTVFENVELPLTYLKISPSERREKVHNVLEKLGLIPRKNFYPCELSGGQQQRVGIARAIVTDPKVILADEPTGNLDSANGHDVMTLFTELNEMGGTIIMVTHSEAYAEYAHRTIHLFDGHVVTENMNTRFYPQVYYSRDI